MRHDPLGVVTIISAFNYPVQLLLLPFIGAIAGGNCCILKPAEGCPKSAIAMKKLCEKYMDSSAFRFVFGGIPETSRLLQQPVNLIFFTGSGRVGRIVAEAAAKQLIPVILELGGKSPVLIDKTADIKLAAKRIGWAKVNTKQSTVCC